MPSNYGTSNYGETSTYSYVVITAGVYGDSNYGEDSYNAPVYASATTSRFGLETLLRNFTNDLGIVRYTLIKAADAFIASSQSDLSSSYNLNVIFEPLKLLSLVKFESEQIVEAEDMTNNFQLLADVIRSTSNEEDLNTGPVLVLDETAAAITEVDSSYEGLALSSNALLANQDITAAATRQFPDRSGISSALLLNGSGLRLFSASSTIDTVVLGESFGFFDNIALFSSPISGQTFTDRRGLYQPFEDPVVISGLNAAITTAQLLVVDTQSRQTTAIELSVEVSVNSTTPITIKFGSDVDSNAALGYILYLPAGSRTVTKRIRVALSSGKKLRVELSQKCTAITLRVVGTWG